MIRLLITLLFGVVIFFNKSSELAIIIPSCLAISHLLSKSTFAQLAWDKLFVVSFYVVHFLWPILIVFQGEYYKYALNTELTLLSLRISGIGLVAFLVVHRFFSMRPLRNTPSHQPKLPLGIMDAAIALILIIFFLVAGNGYFTAEVYRKGGTSDSVSGLGGYVYSILVIFFVLRISRRQNFKILEKQNVLFSLTLLMFVVGSALSGDRSVIVMLGLAMLAANYKQFTKLSLGTKVLGAGVGISLLGAIRIYRAKLNFQGIQNEIWGMLINLGDSYRVLTSTIEIVEEQGLYLGKTWFGPIAGTLPFFQGYLVKNGVLSVETLNTPNVITFYRFGNLHTSGEGSTLISDIFLNWGMLGTMFFMGVYGGIGAYLTKHATSRPFAFCLLCATSVYIARATFLYPLKFYIWGVLIASLLTLGNQILRR